MGFGEKLLKLRKENGMSQEALAERLNTSRQAISKWENGQGFPESEKLLKIGNIFNVSIDYLLKDTVDQKAENKNGYYVSKEMIEGFLLREKKVSKYIALAISLILASYIPYLIFKYSFAIYSIIITIMITIGFSIFLTTEFMEDDYKVLKRETLIFDESVLKELKKKYAVKRKKYIILMIIGICFIFAGGTTIFLLKKVNYVDISLNANHSILVFLIIIGLYIFIYVASIMDAYDLLVKNEEYVNKLSFKLSRKLREKKASL